MDLQLMAQQLRKPEGEAGVQIGEMMNGGNARLYEAALQRLRLHDSDRLLEIGMGNGHFVKDIFAIAPGINYDGVDYSELMVDEAGLRNQPFISEGKARFVHATADELPYDDGSFNCVLTINTVYFWGDAKKELAEIRRVLSDDGQLVIGIRSRETMDAMPFTEYGFVKYDREDLEQLLKENGYFITEAEVQLEPPYEFRGAMLQLKNVIISCSKG